MFDMPDAKRVRREDLYTSDDDATAAAPSAIDDSRAQHLHAQLAQLYGPIPPAAAPTPSTDTLPDAPPTEAADEEEDESFEFRLFASPTTTSTSNAAPAPPQRIILSHSDDEGAGDGAFTVPQRAQSWYIAAPATGARLAQFADAAVSAQTVVEWSKRRAWALERPWRVGVVRTGGAAVAAKVGKTPRAAPAVRRRVDVEVDMEVCGKERTGGKPNKKRRIVLRMRERALAEQKVEATRREEENAGKKTARNREKQAKRREKEKAEKAKKAAAAAAGLPDVGGGGGDIDGDAKMTDVAT